MMAVRYFKRAQDLSDVDSDVVRAILREAETTPEEAEEIYAMTALPTVYERFVLPPIQREEAIESACSPELCKGECGVGFVQLAKRGT
jgi:nitrate reductase beta subunit